MDFNSRQAELAYRQKRLQEERAKSSAEIPLLRRALTAVGVRLVDLTAAQIKAIMALVLYNQGGVSSTLTVKPLTSWVTFR